MSERRMRSGWVLWADWCLAVGHSSLVVSTEKLDAYARAVSKPNLSDVKATFREFGIAWPGDDISEPFDPRAGYESSLAPLEVALGRCEQRGWPTGYRGRRDAWLLVLTRGLRLTRREALGVRASDVADLVETLPERRPGESPLSCWRCTAARWIEVVNLSDDWSWRTVREHLLRPRRELGQGHACDDGVPEVNEHLDVSALAPSIDQYGGGVPGRTMSQRALTYVIASRSARSWTPQIVVRTGPEQPVFGDVDEAAAAVFDATTFDRLEAAMDAADEVNARIEALLADTSKMLGS